MVGKKARVGSHLMELAAQHCETSKILSQLARERRKGQEKRIDGIFAQPIFAATPTLDAAIWRSL
jgi:hypothetical protein